MVGTEFISGYGLGNHLFCYVTARSIAHDNGYEFGTVGQDIIGVNIHSNRGMYFMDMDLGHNISKEAKPSFNVYNDDETRLFLGNSRHDIENGVYISGPDAQIMHVPDNTLIYGNMQDESYFLHNIDLVKEWLKVKPEYDSYEYSRENLCIINMRGGEYTSNPELFIDKKYWLHGIKEMRKIRPDMEFMIVTDDVEAANKTLPGIEAHHFDIAKDYVTIKNAHYLLLSNSSFACLPAHTSETLKYVIAPKYWARFNVSDGYWASEQNIYSLFHYMDKKGRIFSAEECRKELEEYKKRSRKYKRRNMKPSGIRRIFQIIRSRLIRMNFWGLRIVRSLKRRLHLEKKPIR